jgi:hypothetical protein
MILSVILVLGGCQYLQRPNDQAITSEVQSKLFADSVLKTRDIRVTTDSGVVTLSGSVETELEKAAAGSLAAQGKGVRKVVNELAVGATTAQATEMPTSEPAPAAASEPIPGEALLMRTPIRRLETPAATSKPARAATSKSTQKTAPAVSPREPEGEAASTTEAPSATTAQAPAVTAVAPSEPAPRQPEQITIPAGTVVTVRMVDGIDSSQHRPGEEFAASVEAPVVVNDKVIIRKGSDARVRLVQARSAGRMTGQSELEVELVGLAIGDQTFAVESTAYEKVGASRGKRTAATVGGGAALGGLIGAVAGKGKGAAIGAAVGAGAGTAVQAATKGQQVQIPPETKLDFTLKAPLTVTM